MSFRMIRKAMVAWLTDFRRWLEAIRFQDRAFIILPCPVAIVILVLTSSLELTLALSYLACLASLQLKDFSLDLNLGALRQKFEQAKTRRFRCQSNELKLIRGTPPAVESPVGPFVEISENYVAMKIKVYSDDTEKFIVALRERIRNNVFLTLVVLLFLLVKLGQHGHAVSTQSGVSYDIATTLAALAGMAIQILNLLKPLWVYRERNAGI